jgi:hypothetical protein
MTSRRERDARYNKSEKGRARYRRYNNSQKGRLRNERYYDELMDDMMRRLRRDTFQWRYRLNKGKLL